QTVFISRGGTNSFYDLANGEKTHRLQTASSDLRNPIFEPKGETLLTIGPGSLIRLWNSQTGEKLQQLDDYDPLYKSAVFSPTDDLLMLNPSWMGNIRLWNIEEVPSLQTIVRSEVSDDHSTIDA